MAAHDVSAENASASGGADGLVAPTTKRQAQQTIMGMFGMESRDERRRRRPAEETAPGNTKAPATASTPTAATPAATASLASPPAKKRMSSGSSREPLALQMRITDLIPQRPVGHGLWLVGGLTVVTALEAAYYWQAEILRTLGVKQLAALDLTADCSLASWFSSTLLAGAGLVSLLIYAVRRQKPDDYHGRYRVYLWAAVAWLVMSIDATSNLHDLVAEILTHHSGTAVHADGAIWWVAGYAMVLAPICLRAVLEMRQCGGSTTLFLLAVGCYLTAVAARLGVVLPVRDQLLVMIEKGCELGGHVLLVAALAWHARFVIRQALGLIEERSAEPRAAKPKASAAASTPPKRSDLDAPPKLAAQPAPTRAKPAAEQPRYDEAEDEDDDRDERRRHDQRHDDEEGRPLDRKLNKAQLKALRRQKEAERRGRLD